MYDLISILLDYVEGVHSSTAMAGVSEQTFPFLGLELGQELDQLSLSR